MAISKNGSFSGAIGEIITYSIAGKEYKRARPTEVKQTKSMKLSARDFGNIKSISACLRQGLAGLVPNYKSKPIMFAVDKPVRRWYYEYYLRNETAVMDSVYFNSLQLNPEATPFVKSLLGVEPVIDRSIEGKITLHIPEMKKGEMMLPPGATALSFTFAVTSGSMCDREIGKKDRWFKSDPQFSCSDAIEIPISNEGLAPLSIAVNYGLNFDALTLAFLAVRYKNAKGWMAIEKWKPLVVVGSWFDKPEKRAIVTYRS